MAVDKLIDSTQLDSDLEDIADAIRAKGGASSTLAFPAGFIAGIGNIPSGGGTSIPLVTGSFTPAAADAGSAEDVSLSYTGNGYPLFAIIYPKGGYKTGSDIKTSAKYRAIMMWGMSKLDMSAIPDYSANDEKNKTLCMSVYKNDSAGTDPTVFNAQASTEGRSYYNSNASASSTACARFKDKSTLSVFVGDTSFGFLAGVEYTYQILYSA